LIFVTVGTQLPFDRLTKTVDRWAANCGRRDIIAQIGETDFAPIAMNATAFISPENFEFYQQNASVLIAHAGMGSIIGALEMVKPLIIMPRLASLGEHRNDHQVATARRFQGRPGIYVAMDTTELEALLEKSEELAAGDRISPYASAELIGALSKFIRQAD